MLSTVIFCSCFDISSQVIDILLYTVYSGWTVPACCNSVPADCNLVRDGVWCRKRTATSHSGSPHSGPSESRTVLSAFARVLSNSGKLQQGRVRLQ